MAGLPLAGFAGHAPDAPLATGFNDQTPYRHEPFCRPAALPPRPRTGSARPAYLAALTWAFTLFNSVRTLAYLPTMWAIWASGDSSQHSLWTWCTWLGANATMAAWLYEHNGQRVNRAVVVNIGNATMCAATVVMIAAHRGWPW